MWQRFGESYTHIGGVEMLFYMYIHWDDDGEPPLHVAPVGTWVRALKIISWARHNGHRIRMVAVRSDGTVMKDTTYAPVVAE